MTDMTVEEYAIDLVAHGGESCAEDDLNEDGRVAAAGHEAAVKLALDIARAIRANPDAVLSMTQAWRRGERYDLPPADAAVEAAARTDHAHCRLAGEPDWADLLPHEADSYRSVAGKMLAAAGPLVAASALRSAAEMVERDGGTILTATWAADALRERADQLERTRG